MQRNLRLFICAAVYSCSFNILTFSMVFIFQDRFGFESGKIGAYMAAGSLMYAFCCFVYQRAGTGVKPGSILPVSVSCCLIAVIVESFTKTSIIAVLCYLMVQASASVFWPPLMSWFSKGLSGEKLNSNIGFFNMSWMGGTLLGPFIGGTLYHIKSFYVFPAILLGLLFVILMLIRLAMLSAKNGWAEETEKSPEVKAVAEAESLLAMESAPDIPSDTKSENLLAFFKIRGWISVFAGNMLTGILLYTMPLFLRNELGVTERTIGQILLGRGLAAFTGFALLSRISVWHFNRRWFILLQSVICVTVLFFIVSGRMIWPYYILIFAAGLLQSGGYNNSLFHSSADKKNSRKNIAFHESSHALGSMIGALVGGLTYQYGGKHATFIVLEAVQLFCLVFFLYPGRYKKYPA